MSEPWPIKDEELDRWSRLDGADYYPSVILRLVKEVRNLRGRLKAADTNERERIEADGARGWHWECVQEIAARVLAGMLSRSDVDGSECGEAIHSAVDVAGALVVEVARRREMEAGDG